MRKQVISRIKVRELYDGGESVTEIAAELGCGKGTVSKILKEMNINILKAAMVEAPKYVAAKDSATETLSYLINKAKDELEWIERSVVPKTDAEYRCWEDQKLKFGGEMRKLISTVADIGYRLFQLNEIAEILREIDEEIGNESPECQARIRKRLERRRNIRFPVEFDRTPSGQ